MKKIYSYVFGLSLIIAIVFSLCSEVYASPDSNKIIDVSVSGSEGIGEGGDAPGTTAIITDENELWIWGNNEYGQIGDGTTVDREIPVKIMEDVKIVKLADYYSMAIKTDGSLWAWGNCFYGDGNPMTQRETPKKIMEGVLDVEVDDLKFSVIKTDYSLWVCGSSYIGNGTNEPSYSPVKIMDNVRQVSTFAGTNAAIKKDDTLWTWGDNLGNGTNETSNIPIKIMDDVDKVSICFQGFVIKNDESLWAWGSNALGALGTGDNTAYVSNSPVHVMDDVVSVYAGHNNPNFPITFSVYSSKM